MKDRLFSRQWPIQNLTVGLLTAIAVVVALAVMGCGRGAGQEGLVAMRSLRDVPEARLANLARMRIFFGHQSVGGNIVDGVRDLIKDDPRIGLRVVNLSAPPTAGQVGLADMKIGQNGDPAGKTDEFVQVLESGLGGSIDIAIHKYCYGDLWKPESVPVDHLFINYTAAMKALALRYPRVIFVHVSMPLTRPELGLKGRIRELVGVEIQEYAQSMAINRFNDLLRHEYAGKEPLFDLALIESTRPDGTQESFEYRGRSYQRLVEQYTSDGGHLNEVGRRRVAEQFLIFLADLARDGR